jgi:hypothetical protein
VATLNDDYDPRQLIQELSANLTQPDKFAEIFCTAAKTQKRIDEVLNERIRDLLKNDNDSKNAITLIIKDYDKEGWKFLGKKLALIIWSLLLIVIGVLADKFLGK